ncbi:MAG: 2-C-methyl-D-erythritol 4-phosphate cytidylyltransferase [Actinobacteria bacterium]|nr:2-C-methyl-D-erythritol 4-phosphate cytidylyltransferase [Actinomycetota bacterium]
MGDASLTAVIVPAAGRGERLGPGAPKALRTLAGQPILLHAVRNLATARAIDLIVVAVPEDAVEESRALLAGIEIPLTIVSGGDTRQDSVARALLALPPEVDVVLVHDAARPLVPAEVVDRVAAAVRGGAEAVIPTLGVVDTIKEVDGDGIVRATLDRSRLHAVQTPQGFDRDVLQQAHAASDGEDATDDAGMVERMGLTVCVVPGHEEAFKITRPLDLVLAEAILVRRRAAGGVG